MRRYVEHGEGLPAWQSPISHAVVVGDTCYLSGQLAFDEAGSYVPGTAHEEAERAFGRLFLAIDAAGFSPLDLVFVEIALRELDDLAEVDGVWGALFPAGKRPARTVAQVTALPFGARMKVHGVAARSRG